MNATPKPKRVLKRFERIIQVLNVVQEYPCSTAREIYDILSRWPEYSFCFRTLLRDLDLLVELGIVEESSIVKSLDRNRRCKTFDFADDLKTWPLRVRFDPPCDHSV